MSGIFTGEQELQQTKMSNHLEKKLLLFLREKEIFEGDFKDSRRSFVQFGGCQSWNVTLQ